MTYPIRWVFKLARDFAQLTTTEQLFVFGVAAIAAGVALYSMPAGLIALGVIVCIVTWRLGMAPVVDERKVDE